MVNITEDIDFGTNNLSGDGGSIDVDSDIDFVGNQDILDVDDIYGTTGNIDFNNTEGLILDGTVDGDDGTYIVGKLTVEGSTDPPCVLFDCKTRKEIIDLANDYHPPSKQDGAAMFFNKETKLMEVYIQSEGKFYDLNGNLLETVAVKKRNDTEKIYLFNRKTGEIEERQKLKKKKQDVWKIKRGLKFNKKTGEFVDKEGKKINKEEAIDKK